MEGHAACVRDVDGQCPPTDLRIRCNASQNPRVFVLVGRVLICFKNWQADPKIYMEMQGNQNS